MCRTVTKSSKKEEVLINGRVYDLSGFRRKHPGGSIYKFYVDDNNFPDATDAFNNFHRRSDKAKKWLKNWPSRELTAEEKQTKIPESDQETALLDDFHKLEQEFKDEGLFDPSIPHAIWRCAEILIMHVIGIKLMYAGYLVPAFILLGLATGRCGWWMHELGHHATGLGQQTDIWLHEFFYGFGCGMSGAFWRNQHNKHHATPQKLEHDVDLATMPLVAFHSSVVGRQGLIGKLWTRAQAILFPTLSCLLVGLGWQYFLHLRYMQRTKQVREFLWVVLRHIAIWQLFGQYGLSNVVKGYICYVWIGCVYIFTNFSLSHTHLPVTNPDEFLNWVRYSSDHTTNIHPGHFGWVNWWMGYLNFQIEHHLFPAMLQYRFPKVHVRIKALFEKHGIHYDQRTYFGCWSDTLSNLNQIGKQALNADSSKPKRL